MDVFLTGGTGLVGSAVLRALLEDGHTVHALARSDSSAATLADAGATVVRGDVEDPAVLAGAARTSDGVVHTAAAADGRDAERDAALLDAVLPVLAGTGKTYVHTSGVWVHGSGVIDEETPFAPPSLTAWRLPLDARVRAAASDGVRSVVIAPGIVHGRGAGLEPTTVPATDADTEARFGPLAGAFGLDQQASGERARAELGWKPTGPSLLEDLSSGSYAG
jgi:nucleoside-diphosphate-sugar epimerase